VIAAPAHDCALANYEYLQGAGIKPAIPRHDSWKKKVLSRRKFTYDPQTDTYLCPEEQRLHRYEVRPEAGIVRYRASRMACRLCLRKTECPRGARRTASPHFKEPVLDWALSYLQTEQAQQSVRQRKVWVETAIAEVKNGHGLQRASFRGRRKVLIQILLTAATYNLKKLARNALKAQSEEAKTRLEHFETVIARTLSSISWLRSLVPLPRPPA
jgi:hypothetical protein